MSAPIRDGLYAQLPNGIRLHYAACGEAGKPLLLFVHGFPEAWFKWEKMLAEFGGERFAVAPDLRGFNLSSKPAAVEKYRAEALVEDLVQLIELLGYAKATVVAHDWGGAVAWQLAIRVPQRVERLIIVNSPHPYLFWRALQGSPAQRKASAYMNFFRKPGVEAALAKDDFRNLEGAFRGPGGPASWYTPERRARYHAAWSVPGEDGSHALTGGLNYYRVSPLHPPVPGEPEPATREWKPADWMVRVPTRVIWGENDTALLPELLDGLGELVPDLKIKRIPDASHWVVHEQPATVSALIRSFLA